MKASQARCHVLVVENLCQFQIENVFRFRKKIIIKPQQENIQ